jgi:hypothetical protein
VVSVYSRRLFSSSQIESEGHRDVNNFSAFASSKTSRDAERR